METEKETERCNIVVIEDLNVIGSSITERWYNCNSKQTNSSQHHCKQGVIGK